VSLVWLSRLSTLGSPFYRQDLQLHTGTVCMRIAKRYGKGKGSPYSITERRLPELIPVLGSQPAPGVSHKPGDRYFVNHNNKQ